MPRPFRMAGRGLPALPAVGKCECLVLRGLSWNRLPNSANARIKEGARIRPPPRGGWRGHEWDVHAWKKGNGRGRDGGSTALGRRGKYDSVPAMNESRIMRLGQVDACIDGLPQYSPAARSIRSEAAIQRTVFRRAVPPSRKGANACAYPIHALDTAPIVTTPSSQSTEIPEEPFLFLFRHAGFLSFHAGARQGFSNFSSCGFPRRFFRLDAPRQTAIMRRHLLKEKVRT